MCVVNKKLVDCEKVERNGSAVAYGETAVDKEEVALKS
jgi:hypothetical protein